MLRSLLPEFAVQSGSTNQETTMDEKTDLDEVLRDLQRRRNTSEQVRERRKHADSQLKYRMRLEGKRAPTRAD